MIPLVLGAVGYMSAGGDIRLLAAIESPLKMVSAAAMYAGGISLALAIYFFHDWVKQIPDQPNHVNRPVKLIDDQHVPKFAEYLLHFLPKKDREQLLGDLEEEYRGIYKKFGRRKATFWYYCQVVMSFWPYIAHTIMKLLGWGVVGWVGSAIRRLIG